MSLATIYTWLAIAAVSSAHTWVEQMQEIDANGSFTGAMGYGRGYIPRNNPTFNGNSEDYLLPSLASGRLRINGSDLLCHPAQRTANQTEGFPKLVTSPGKWVGLKYLENGHVTLPQNQPGKPVGSGTVFIFATKSPLEDEKIADVLAWNYDGSGGDGRGTLLTANNFDDGRCHQLNGGILSAERQKEFPDRVPEQPESNVEQWCETDVQIPSNMTNGPLTLYFVWDWYTSPGAPGLPEGKDEYYTTCIDITLASNTTVNSTVLQEASEQFALEQQDPQTQAVSTFNARTAYQTLPRTLNSAGVASTGTNSANLASATDSALIPSSLATSAPSSIAARDVPPQIGVSSSLFSISARTLSDVFDGPAEVVKTYTGVPSSIYSAGAADSTTPANTSLAATSSFSPVATTSVEASSSAYTSNVETSSFDYTSPSAATNTAYTDPGCGGSWPTTSVGSSSDSVSSSLSSIASSLSSQISYVPNPTQNSSITSDAPSQPTETSPVLDTVYITATTLVTLTDVVTSFADVTSTPTSDGSELATSQSSVIASVTSPSPEVSSTPPQSSTNSTSMSTTTLLSSEFVTSTSTISAAESSTPEPPVATAHIEFTTIQSVISVPSLSTSDASSAATPQPTLPFHEIDGVNGVRRRDTREQHKKWALSRRQRRQLVRST